ncbi:MAG: alanine racemase [Anaerolineae bacterium]|nr:alanine racemase [Anaerolineae bacterium]
MLDAVPASSGGFPVSTCDSTLTCAVIDLDAIAHNTHLIRARVGPSPHLIAVVKANAYGHGAVPVAQTVLRNGADWLAVGRVCEGLALREAGITAPILILGYSLPAEAPAAVAANLTLALTELPVARALAEQARALGREVCVHVKVDTGMGRFGLLPEEVVPFLDQVAALEGLRVAGLYTHFAAADWADKTPTLAQFARFQAVIAAARAAGHELPLCHAANSSAILDQPELFLDAVRAGIILYGLFPSRAVAHDLPLRPALALKTHVGRVRTLPAGAGIGYEWTFTTPRPMTAAMISVGYGDGYPRLFSGQGAVLINGKRAPIVGRVSMDHFMVDVSDVGPVAVDDEVVLVGRQGDDVITVEELAGWAGTINYQIVAGLLPRAVRVYTGEGSSPTG